MSNGNKTMIRDMTTGSVTRHLLVFAFPLMLSNLLQTLYNMVDMVVIGQFVGKTGLSAVSIGGDILHLITFLVIGFSNAGQVILSQYIGAKNTNKVKSTIGTMFTVILASGLLMGLLTPIFLNKILQWMNTPAEVYKDCWNYSIVCILGILFIYGYNLISAIMRGMGDSKRPLMFVAVATVVNTLLDLLFVAVFKMGAAGAALATVIGQGVSFVWAIVYLYRRKEAFGFDFKPRSFIPDKEVVSRLFGLGIPMAFQMAAILVSMMVVNAFINAYGVVAISVTGIGSKLTSIASVVTMALSQGGSTMIGQSIGAKAYDRVGKVIKVSMIIDMIVAAVLSAITVIWPTQVFGIFNSEPDVLAMALTYIPVAVISFMGFGFRSPLFGLINGSGNPRLNLWVAILDGVVCRIGFSIGLGLLMNFGLMGYWVGSAIAGYVPFFIGIVFFFCGTWKREPNK